MSVFRDNFKAYRTKKRDEQRYFAWKDSLVALSGGLLLADYIYHFDRQSIIDYFLKKKFPEAYRTPNVAQREARKSIPEAASTVVRDFVKYGRTYDEITDELDELIAFAKKCGLSDDEIQRLSKKADEKIDSSFYSLLNLKTPTERAIEKLKIFRRLLYKELQDRNLLDPYSFFMTSSPDTVADFGLGQLMFNHQDFLDYAWFKESRTIFKLRRITTSADQGALKSSLGKSLTFVDILHDPSMPFKLYSDNIHARSAEQFITRGFFSGLSQVGLTKRRNLKYRYVTDIVKRISTAVRNWVHEGGHGDAIVGDIDFRVVNIEGTPFLRVIFNVRDLDGLVRTLPLDIPINPEADAIMFPNGISWINAYQTRAYNPTDIIRSGHVMIQRIESAVKSALNDLYQGRDTQRVTKRFYNIISSGMDEIHLFRSKDLYAREKLKVRDIPKSRKRAIMLRNAINYIRNKIRGKGKRYEIHLDIEYFSPSEFTAGVQKAAKSSGLLPYQFSYTLYDTKTGRVIKVFNIWIDITKYFNDNPVAMEDFRKHLQNLYGDMADDVLREIKNSQFKIVDSAVDKLKYALLKEVRHYKDIQFVMKGGAYAEIPILGRLFTGAKELQPYFNEFLDIEEADKLGKKSEDVFKAMGMVDLVQRLKEIHGIDVDAKARKVAEELNLPETLMIRHSALFDTLVQAIYRQEVNKFYASDPNLNSALDAYLDRVINSELTNNVDVILETMEILENEGLAVTLGNPGAALKSNKILLSRVHLLKAIGPANLAKQSYQILTGASISQKRYERTLRKVYTGLAQALKGDEKVYGGLESMFLHSLIARNPGKFLNLPTAYIMMHPTIREGMVVMDSDVVESVGHVIESMNKIIRIPRTEEGVILDDYLRRALYLKKIWLHMGGHNMSEQQVERAFQYLDLADQILNIGRFRAIAKNNDYYDWISHDRFEKLREKFFVDEGTKSVYKKLIRLRQKLRTAKDFREVISIYKRALELIETADRKFQMNLLDPNDFVMYTGFKLTGKFANANPLAISIQYRVHDQAQVYLKTFPKIFLDKAGAYDLSKDEIEYLEDLLQGKTGNLGIKVVLNILSSPVKIFGLSGKAQVLRARGGTLLRQGIGMFEEFSIAKRGEIGEYLAKYLTHIGIEIQRRYGEEKVNKFMKYLEKELNAAARKAYKEISIKYPDLPEFKSNFFELGSEVVYGLPMRIQRMFSKIPFTDPKVYNKFVILFLKNLIGEEFEEKGVDKFIERLALQFDLHMLDVVDNLSKSDKEFLASIGFHIDDFAYKKGVPREFAKILKFVIQKYGDMQKVTRQRIIQWLQDARDDLRENKVLSEQIEAVRKYIVSKSPRAAKELKKVSALYRFFDVEGFVYPGIAAFEAVTFAGSDVLWKMSKPFVKISYPLFEEALRLQQFNKMSGFMDTLRYYVDTDRMQIVNSILTNIISTYKEFSLKDMMRKGAVIISTEHPNEQLEKAIDYILNVSNIHIADEEMISLGISELNEENLARLMESGIPKILKSPAKGYTKVDRSLAVKAAVLHLKQVIDRLTEGGKRPLLFDLSSIDELSLEDLGGFLDDENLKKTLRNYFKNNRFLYLPFVDAYKHRDLVINLYPDGEYEGAVVSDFLKGLSSIVKTLYEYGRAKEGNKLSYLGDVRAQLIKYLALIFEPTYGKNSIIADILFNKVLGVSGRAMSSVYFTTMNASIGEAKWEPYILYAPKDLIDSWTKVALDMFGESGKEAIERNATFYGGVVRNPEEPGTFFLSLIRPYNREKIKARYGEGEPPIFVDPLLWIYRKFGDFDGDDAFGPWLFGAKKEEIIRRIQELYGISDRDLSLFRAYMEYSKKAEDYEVLIKYVGKEFADRHPEEIAKLIGEDKRRLGVTNPKIIKEKIASKIVKRLKEITEKLPYVYVKNVTGITDEEKIQEFIDEYGLTAEVDIEGGLSPEKFFEVFPNAKEKIYMPRVYMKATKVKDIDRFTQTKMFENLLQKMAKEIREKHKEMSVIEAYEEAASELVKIQRASDIVGKGDVGKIFQFMHSSISQIYGVAGVLRRLKTISRAVERGASREEILKQYGVNVDDFMMDVINKMNENREFAERNILMTVTMLDNIGLKGKRTTKTGIAVLEDIVKESNKGEEYLLKYLNASEDLSKPLLEFGVLKKAEDGTLYIADKEGFRFFQSAMTWARSFWNKQNAQRLFNTGGALKTDIDKASHVARFIADLHAKGLRGIYADFLEEMLPGLSLLKADSGDYLFKTVGQYFEYQNALKISKALLSSKGKAITAIAAGVLGAFVLKKDRLHGDPFSLGFDLGTIYGMDPKFFDRRWVAPELPRDIPIDADVDIFHRKTYVLHNMLHYDRRTLDRLIRSGIIQKDELYGAKYGAPTELYEQIKTRY